MDDDNVKVAEVEQKTLLEQAVETAERIEKANAEMKELLARQEFLITNELLGGRSDAGQTLKVETADEKWAREAEIRYAGTGMSPVPKKK